RVICVPIIEMLSPAQKRGKSRRRADSAGRVACSMGAWVDDVGMDLYAFFSRQELRRLPCPVSRQNSGATSYLAPWTGRIDLTGISVCAIMRHMHVIFFSLFELSWDSVTSRFRRLGRLLASTLHTPCAVLSERVYDEQAVCCASDQLALRPPSRPCPQRSPWFT